MAASVQAEPIPSKRPPFKVKTSISCPVCHRTTFQVDSDKIQHPTGQRPDGTSIKCEACEE